MPPTNQPDTEERYNDFCKKHGDSVPDPDSRQHLFEDGAILIPSYDGYSTYSEPPVDDYKRAKPVRKYHFIKADRALQRLQDFKEQQLFRINFAKSNEQPGLMPDKDLVTKELRKLRAALRKEQIALQKANEAMEALKPREEIVAENTRVLVQQMWTELTDLVTGFRV